MWGPKPGKFSFSVYLLFVWNCVCLQEEHEKITQVTQHITHFYSDIFSSQARHQKQYCSISHIRLAEALSQLPLRLVILSIWRLLCCLNLQDRKYSSLRVLTGFCSSQFCGSAPILDKRRRCYTPFQLNFRSCNNSNSFGFQLFFFSVFFFIFYEAFIAVCYLTNDALIALSIRFVFDDVFNNCRCFTACVICVWICFYPFNSVHLCSSSSLHGSLSHQLPWLPPDLSLPCFLQYESDELEKSVYQDYDSDSDVPEELKQDFVDEQTGDAPLKRSVPRPLWRQITAKSCVPYIQLGTLSPHCFKCVKGS